MKVMPFYLLREGEREDISMRRAPIISNDKS